MTSEQKKYYWQQHFNDWEQSSLSQSDFCKKNNLNIGTFGYWRTKLCSKVSAKAKFIPVTIQKPLPSVKVFLPSGIRLEVPANSVAEVLPLLSRYEQEIVNVAP